MPPGKKGSARGGGSARPAAQVKPTTDKTATAKPTPEKTPPAPVTPTPAVTAPVTPTPEKTPPAPVTPTPDQSVLAGSLPEKTVPVKADLAKRVPGKTTPDAIAPVQATTDKAAPGMAAAPATPGTTPSVKPTPERKTSNKTTPVEATRDPAKAAPAKATPDKTAPDKTAPAKTTPGKKTTAKATSDKTTSDKTVPVQATPDKKTSDKATPDKTAPMKPTPDKKGPGKPTDKTVPVQATPDQKTSDKTVLVQANPDKKTSDKTVPVQATSDKKTSDKTVPVQANPDKKTLDKTVPVQATPDTKTSDKATPDKTAPIKPTPDKKGPGKPTPAKKDPAQPTPDRKASAKPTPDKKAPVKPIPVKPPVPAPLDSEPAVACTAVAPTASFPDAAVVDFQVSDWSDLDPHFTQLCSDATLQSDRRGFFLDLAEKVTDEAGLDFIDQFSRLTDDRQRISACYSSPKVRDAVRGILANVQPVFRDKAADVSAQRRLDGERVLKGGNARGALTTLSQAVMRAPAPAAPAPAAPPALPLFALALWSRSEALLQLRHFQLCIDDVQLSMKSGLPEDKRLEAFYRMGLCLHGLGDVKRAAVSLQVAARLLEKIKDPAEKIAWTATIQQAVGALRVPREGKPLASESQKAVGPPPPLAGGQHPDHPAASGLLRVARTPSAGRHMEAARPVSAGDTLVVEAPEAACLLPDKFGTHCLHCFGRLLAPVPCEECSGVAFCGRECRAAAAAYHRHECRHLGLLLGSGMSVLCHLALRAVAQRGLAFLRGLRAHLGAAHVPDQAKETLSEEQHRFLKMYFLEAHDDRRPGKDFVQRSMMALFLLRILQQSGFFPEVSSLGGDMNEDELLVGAVLLRLLQILQFNAHEVYETVILPPKDGQDDAAAPRSKFRSAKIVYIGVAVYPTVALFNHDCYPAVTRHFRGRDIVVTAVRPLAEGQVVAENYGPIFTKRTLQQRQRTLNSRYWFRCDCTACAEDWPLMADLPEDELRFRCPTRGCPQALRAPRAQDAVGSARCPRCGADVDLEALRSRLRATRADFDAALEAMERDAAGAALPLLCRFLDAMHALARPPVRAVSLAQEALRTCLADSGNVWAAQ